MEWAYHFTDFRLGRLLATIPLRDVELSDVLSGAAEGKAVVPLSSRALRNRDPFLSTTPRRTCMWAERRELDDRTGRVVASSVPWAGLVMKRSRSRVGRSMALSMVTWESYFLRRLLRDRTFVQGDKFTIFRALVRDAVRQVTVTPDRPATPMRVWGPIRSRDLSREDYDRVRADGWAPRPYNDPPVAQAARALAARFRSGELIYEDWSYAGYPDSLSVFNGWLLDAYSDTGRHDDPAGWLEEYARQWATMPAPAAAALIIYGHMNKGRAMFEDWTWRPGSRVLPNGNTQAWDGSPQVVKDYNDELQARWRDAGRPDALGWLRQYVHANGPDERLYHPLAATDPNRDPGTIYVQPGTPLIPGSEVPVAPDFPLVPPHLLPLDTLDGPLSGVRADRTYLASDLKPTLEALLELGRSGDGFDWKLVPYMERAGDLNSFRVRLALGSPRLGRIASPDLQWSTLPEHSRLRWGYIADCTVVEDGSLANNRITALGEGNGPTQLRAVAQSAPDLAAGVPLYESSLAGSTADLRTQGSVDSYAAGALAAGLSSQVKVSGVVVRGDVTPTLPTVALGDDATLHLDESMTGEALRITGQIVGRKINPPQQGSTELVTMDVQGVG